MGCPAGADGGVSAGYALVRTWSGWLVEVGVRGWWLDGRVDSVSGGRGHRRAERWSGRDLAQAWRSRPVGRVRQSDAPVVSEPGSGGVPVESDRF